MQEKRKNELKLGEKSRTKQTIITNILRHIKKPTKRFKQRWKSQRWCNFSLNRRFFWSVYLDCSIKIKQPPARCHVPQPKYKQFQSNNLRKHIVTDTHCVAFVLLPFFFAAFRRELSLSVSNGNAKTLVWVPCTHTLTPSTYIRIDLATVLVFGIVFSSSFFVHFTGFRSVAGFITIELHVLFFVIFRLSHTLKPCVAKKTHKRSTQTKRFANETQLNNRFFVHSISSVRKVLSFVIKSVRRG